MIRLMLTQFGGRGGKGGGAGGGGTSGAAPKKSAKEIRSTRVAEDQISSRENYAMYKINDDKSIDEKPYRSTNGKQLRDLLADEKLFYSSKYKTFYSKTEDGKIKNRYAIRKRK